MGHQAVDTIYIVHRTLFIDLRLHDFPIDVVLLWLLERFDTRSISPQSEFVSDRLVRGKPADSDTDYPCHPNQQNPVRPEHGFVAAASDVFCDHDLRHGHSIYHRGQLLRIHIASIAVLAFSWDDADLLRCPHANSKDLAPTQEVDLSDDQMPAQSKRRSEKILLTWLLTLPAAVLLGVLLFYLGRTFQVGAPAAQLSWLRRAHSARIRRFRPVKTL